MTISFDLLPIELQASVADLRRANAPEELIDLLITRTLAALGMKSNRVQVEVWQMEERLGLHLTQIGDKLQADLQTQHGATNQMLIDLRNAQMLAHPQIEEALAGIADIKKLWSELEQWRSRVEGAIIAGDERTERLERKVSEHDQSRDQSLADRRLLRQDMNESKQHRAHLQQQLDAVQQQLADLTNAVQRVEQLLEVAGDHEADE